jgi:PIN domain nuclease of toxin-antitoxin system
MERVLLDASALIAYLDGEPGSENVPATTGEAVISAVNYAETVSILTTRGIDATTIRLQLSLIVIDVLDFDPETAETTGLMIAATKSMGLSLGDRACLATARHTGLPAMTADRSWSNVDVGVEVRLIR